MKNFIKHFKSSINNYLQKFNLNGNKAEFSSFINIFITILLKLLLGLYVSFAIYLCMIYVKPGFFAQFNDGFGYYIGAKSFFENSSLHGAWIIQNFTSIIGQFPCHGFAYSLLNGGISQIIGWHDKTIIFLNILYIILVFFIIKFRKSTDMSEINKKLLIFLIFAFPIALMSVFSYFQEALNYLFSVIIAFLLVDIYKKNDNKGKQLKTIGIFIFFIILASIFRFTWSFWIVGLIPLFSKNKIQLICSSIFSFFYIFLFFVFSRLIYAPYTLGILFNFASLIKLHEYTNAFNYILHNICYNFYGLFFINYHWGINSFNFQRIYYLIFIFLTLYFGIKGIKEKNKLFIGTSLIGIINIAGVLIVYTTGWAGFKHLFLLYILYLIILASFDRKKILILILLPTIFFMKDAYQNGAESLGLLKNCGDYYKINQAHQDSYDKITQVVKDKKLVTIFISEYILNYEIYYSDLLFMPLKTNLGYPIRYSSNIVHGKDLDTISKLNNFIDYVISEKELNRKDLKFIFNSPLVENKQIISDKTAGIAKRYITQYYFYKVIK